MRRDARTPRYTRSVVEHIHLDPRLTLSQHPRHAAYLPAVTSRRRPAQQYRLRTASAYTHTTHSLVASAAQHVAPVGPQARRCHISIWVAPKRWERVTDRARSLAVPTRYSARALAAHAHAIHARQPYRAPSSQRSSSCSRTPGVAAALMCHVPGRHPSPGSTGLPHPGVQRVGSSSHALPSQDLSSLLVEPLSMRLRDLCDLYHRRARLNGTHPWSPFACDGSI